LTPGSLTSKVRYKLESGRPSCLPSFLQRVSAYVRSGRVRGWKVGISAYPERRFKQHAEAGRGYDEMVVIYRTRSIKNARYIERRVTEEYEGHDNERQGGGGLAAAAEVHYVYLLLRRR
jgi:hypothetical protein